MFIEAIRLSKRFHQKKKSQADEQVVAAVNGVNLSIAPGSMLSLVGASGSGKTTLLRCIAGLETPDEGTIRIAGKTIFSSSPGVNVRTELRNLGLIFQSYALWPNMTVEANVAYPLLRRGMSRTDCASKVAKYLELVGCEHLSDRYPHQLSGGQQQRIALARALVYEPSVILFDEPLSNLDPTLREHLRSQIREIKRSLGFTGIYVTHDLSEAFCLGDQVAIMSNGSLLQVGTPDDIFLRPASPVVARFIGAVNISHGMVSDHGKTFESIEMGRIPVDTDTSPNLADGQPAVLMVRPEAVRLRQGGDTVGIVDRVPMGAFDEYIVRFQSGTQWRIRAERSTLRYETGTRVGIEIPAGGSFVYPNPDNGPLTSTGS